MQMTAPKSPTPSLVEYVEAEIIPRYDSFDRAHGTDHVRTVIRRSLELAARCEVDTDMVYAIAAYHDTGLVAGRERHHLVSAEILAADSRLARWFSGETPEERARVREEMFATTTALRDAHYAKHKANAYYHIQTINLPFPNIELSLDDEEEADESQKP